MASKICKTCGLDKDLSEYHKSSVGAQGRVAHCKICMNWMKRSPEDKAIELKKQKLLEDGKKECGCCHNIFPLEDFPVNKKRPSGRKCYCYECQRIAALERSRRADVKKKKKERESTREFLDNLAEYRQNSDTYKKTLKKYRETSTVFKEYQEEYRKRPYVKVRRDLSTRI